MTDARVRLFEQPSVRLFRLSPLYVEPGWYGTADVVGTLGPYRSKEQAQIALEISTKRHHEPPGRYRSSG